MEHGHGLDEGSSRPLVELAPADWTTADEIRRRRFATVSRGFDPEEVREYLSKLADWFADLNLQLSRLRRAQTAVPVALAEAQPTEASELAARMAELLREAEHHAARVRAEAEERANRILAEAREEAERVRNEGGAMVHGAIAEAEEKLATAHTVREAIFAELAAMQERLAQLAERLDAAGPVTAVPERVVTPGVVAAVPETVVLPQPEPGPRPAP